MELRRYIAILRKRLLLIVLTAIAGVFAAYATTSREPVYEANAQIYVGVNKFINTPSAAGVSADQITGVRQITQTYAVMIDSHPIAAEALSRTGAVGRSAETLVHNLQAVSEPGTTLLRVTVSDKDPVVSQQLANAVVDAFVERIQTLDPSAPPQPGDAPQLPAYVFERARLPEAPIPSGLPQRVTLGFMFAFLVAAGIAFLLEYLDITIKTAADAEQRLELPVLGVIPMERQAPFTPSRAASTVLGT